MAEILETFPEQAFAENVIISEKNNTKFTKVSGHVTKMVYNGGDSKVRIRSARRRLKSNDGHACLAVPDAAGKGGARTGCAAVPGRLKNGVHGGCRRWKTPSWLWQTALVAYK